MRLERHCPPFAFRLLRAIFLFGFLFFAQVPDLLSVAGFGLIVLAGLRARN